MDNEFDCDIFSDGLERVSASAAFLCVSRSMIYKLIEQGVLPSVKIGGSRRIPIRAVRKLASDQIDHQPRSSQE